MESREVGRMSPEVPRGKLPDFLYKNGGTVTTGMQGDMDVTAEYYDYLNSVNSSAPELPSFLYEMDGTIRMGKADDSDVTEEWNEWLNTLRPVETEK